MTNKDKVHVSVTPPGFLICFEDLPGETDSEKFRNAIEKFKAEESKKHAKSEKEDFLALDPEDQWRAYFKKHDAYRGVQALLRGANRRIAELEEEVEHWKGIAGRIETSVEVLLENVKE